MGKVKRQQIIVILLPLIISTLQWTVFGFLDKFNCEPICKNSNCKISTPQECARPCRANEKPRICYYHFTVEHYASLSAACDYGNATASECIRADGIEKSMLTLNRRYPGPQIGVCKGDRVIVDVENSASGTGVTIHWHGLFQKGYQYYDGVPLLTQCPIGESSTFRYDFVAENAGTHMYHSHSSIQMMEGILGSLPVRESREEDPHSGLYDKDDCVIVITDMFLDTPISHLPGKRHGNNTGQTANNLLINGNGINTDPKAVDVAQTIMTKIHIKPGERKRCRLMNLCSSVCLSTLTIEKHHLTLIATDGENVKPINVSYITSATGERVDFIIEASEEINSYWMYLRGDGECSENQVYQLGQIVYEGSKGAKTPQPTWSPGIVNPGPTFNPTNISGCLNNSPDWKCPYQLSNAEGKQPPELRKSKPDVQIILAFGFYFPDDLEQFSGDTYHPYFASPGGGITLWSVVNNISFADPPSPPISQRAGYQTLTEPPCPSANCTGSQVVHVPLNANVEIIFYDAFPAQFLNHPFHLHGHSFAVLDQGYHSGGNDTMADAKRILAATHKKIERGDIKNCARKDTVVVPEGGYSVIRFIANNPGWWLLHCHFTWHTVSGMDIVVHVGKQSDLPPVPPGFPRCGNFVPAIKCPRTNRGW